MATRVAGSCQLAFLLLLLGGLAFPGLGYAAECPEIPAVARDPSAGSPFVTRGVTRLDTQTADNVRITGGCVDVPNLNIDGNSVHATGIADPTEFGARRGNRRDCTVTVSGTAFTVISGTGCTFSAANVGDLITIPQVGATATTAPISSIAVNSAGSAYTTIPTVSLGSVGSGIGFYGYANMALASATVVTGGAGCTNGSQTFTLELGVYGTQAQFTGTVGSNTLSGALAVTVAGSYTQLPVNPSTNGITVTGGSCTTKPVVTSTWNVGTVSVAATGVNYPIDGSVTAAVSSGNATLTNPVAATAPKTVHATTIAAVNSASSITLASTAPNAITSTLVSMAWGPDAAAGINACVAASAAASTECFIPPGVWMASSQIQLDPGGIPASIRCAGPEVSKIVAGASMTQLLYRSDSRINGGTIRDCRFDGNRLATQTAKFDCAPKTNVFNSWFPNARQVANLVLGDGVSGGCGGARISDVRNSNGFLKDTQNLYFGNDVPAYTLQTLSQSNDHVITNYEGVQAATAGVEINSGIIHMIAPHVFPGPDGIMPIAYYIDIASDFIDAFADNYSYVGFWIEANNVNINGGKASSEPNPTGAIGIKIKAGVTDGMISNVHTVKLETVLNRLVVDGGTLDPSWRIRGNAGITPVFFQGSCSGPTGPTTTTDAMMGLHEGQALFVPTTSGKVRVSGIASVGNDTIGSGVQTKANVGQGAPPANAAALVGDIVPVTISKYIAATAAASAAAPMNGMKDALKIGQPYWVDMVAKQLTGGAVSVTNACFTVQEE